MADKLCQPLVCSILVFSGIPVGSGPVVLGPSCNAQLGTIVPDVPPGTAEQCAFVATSFIKDFHDPMAHCLVSLDIILQICCQYWFLLRDGACT